MKKLSVLLLVLFLSVGCLTFGTHRDGSKVSLDLTLDLADVNTTIDKTIGKIIPKEDE